MILIGRKYIHSCYLFHGTSSKQCFLGKPRTALVMEGKKLTGEITGFVGKVLIKEGNIVAAVCAVLGYFALVRKARDDGHSNS
ncbi:hypothetical protein Leryth_009987 [Lithospermum erythrorhizon]|nr:hypothetical protein Leryth_009987 [Lithospermum erythrorhizon]